MSNWSDATQHNAHAKVLYLACMNCKHEWQQRADYTTRCPQCGSSNVMNRNTTVNIPIIHG